MNHSHLLTEQLQWGVSSVLVVDDDPDIISGMKDILEDSGYTVATAACAAEARELLHQNAFNVMVSDYSLPDDNGIRLSRDAKNLQPSLGLILMTGHDPSQILEKLDASVIKLMRKPVEVSVLLGAVETAIQHQCEILKITRKKPAPAQVAASAPYGQPLPPTDFGAPAMVEEMKPETAPETLPDFPMAKRAWTTPLAWAATALIGFGIGWWSRTAVLSRPGNTPVNSKIQPGPAMVRLPARKVTIADAKIVSPARAPRHLQSTLADADPAVRIKAAKTLLKSNPHHDMALKTLLAILRDPLSRHHLAAIESLSTTGASSPEVVSTLARALGDVDPSVACAAATTLGRFGKSALPAVDDLVEALNYMDGSSPSVTRAAKETLIGLGEAAVPALNRKQDDVKIGPLALEVLARIQPPAPGPTSTTLSQNKSPSADTDTDLEDLPDVDNVQTAAKPANDLATDR